MSEREQSAFGDSLSVAAARSKKDRDDDAPVSVPMRGVQRQIRRNPTSDQKKVRRQMQTQRKTAAEENTAMTTEARLLQKMAAATTLDEQRTLAVELQRLREAKAAQMRAEAQVDFSAAMTVPTAGVFALAGATAALHTTATDWLDEAAAPEHGVSDAERLARAEATLWYRSRPLEVRAAREEIQTQAQGYGARYASQFGPAAGHAEQAFLDAASRLIETGLSTVAETVQSPPFNAPENKVDYPSPSKNPDTFDDSLLTGSGQADPKAPSTPSYAEGDTPEGDRAEGSDNPAAGNTHDQSGGNAAHVDYLDGTQTAYPKSSSRKHAETDPKSPTDTPSLAEGGPVEGDHAEPSVRDQDGETHDAAAGDTTTKDYLDGQVYKASSLASLAQAIRAEEPHLNERAATYLAALARLSSAKDRIGGLTGAQVIGFFNRTATLTGPNAAAHTALLAAHASGQVVAADDQTCAACGDKIAKDPSGEDNSTWHHDNGEKHDHEAKPAGGAKESARKTAVSLTNITKTDDPLIFQGKDRSGNVVRFRVTKKESEDLRAVMYSDLAINFSGVDVEESDIVKSAGVKNECEKCGSKDVVQRALPGYDGRQGGPGSGQETVTCNDCGHVKWFAAKKASAEYQGGSPKEGDTATCWKNDGRIEFFDGMWMHLKGGGSHNDVYPATPKERAEQKSSTLAAKGGTEVEVNTLPNCDVCEQRGKISPAAYDSRLPALGGSWGYVCTKCFAMFGPGTVGTGQAQRLVLRSQAAKQGSRYDGVTGVPGSVATCKNCKGGLTAATNGTWLHDENGQMDCPGKIVPVETDPSYMNYTAVPENIREADGKGGWKESSRTALSLDSGFAARVQAGLRA